MFTSLLHGAYMLGTERRQGDRAVDFMVGREGFDASTIGLKAQKVDL